MLRLESFNFGDRIKYRINGNSGEGVVIGFPHYSKNNTIIVLSDEAYHGMPINIKWCKKLPRPDKEKAERLRKRYDDAYPGFLQER